MRYTYLHSCLLILLFGGCAGSTSGQLTLQEQLSLEGKIRELVESAVVEMRTGTPAALDRAQASLEVARDINPNDPRVIDGLGCVEWRRGNLKLAEHFFRRALQLDSNYDRALAHLALILEARGDKNSARLLLQQSVQMNPLNYRNRNNYAALLLDQGETEESYRQLLRAAESGGREEPEIKSNLANVREERD